MKFGQAIMAKRITTVPATGITLDRDGAAPLHRQLYEQLRAAILAGQLGAATRLPSTRTLAGELSVSRTTALLAYEQLRDEGYLDGRVGAGTTVAPLPRQAPPPQDQPAARPCWAPARGRCPYPSTVADWTSPPASGCSRPPGRCT